MPTATPARARNRASSRKRVRTPERSIPRARIVPISRILSYIVMRKVFRMPTMMMTNRTTSTPMETDVQHVDDLLHGGEQIVEGEDAVADTRPGFLRRTPAEERRHGTHSP